MGSAGILPAAVGMLPAALVARLARFPDLIVDEAVRQNAGQGGQKCPRSPYTIP